MSRESEKIFREMHKFMDAHEFDSEEEANEALQQFIEAYNAGLQDNADRPPETAWDYLDMAFDAVSRKEAIKYAKKALELDKYCTDAEVMLAELQQGDDIEKLKKKLEKIIAKSEKHLTEEGYFDEDCVGDFWGILETRPYMRARYKYVSILITMGKYQKAKEECIELLELNENDNMGIRYILMGIYAHFEDELFAIRLYKQYSECSVHMLLPLIVLYYKADSYKTAEKYLRLARGDGFDNYFLDYGLDEELDDDYDDYDDYDDMPPIDGYRIGSKAETADAVSRCPFLYISTPGAIEWIVKKIIKDYDAF